MISDLRGISTLLGQPTLQRTRLPPYPYFPPQCKSNDIRSLCHCAESSSSEPSGKHRPVHVWSPTASRSITVHNEKGSKRPARCRAEKPQSLYASLFLIDHSHHEFSTHQQLLTSVATLIDSNRLPLWRYWPRQKLLPLIRYETPYLAWAQERVRTPTLDSYFAFTANLGTHTFFMVFLPFLFWCGHTSLGRGYALN